MGEEVQQIVQLTVKYHIQYVCIRGTFETEIDIVTELKVP